MLYILLNIVQLHAFAKQYRLGSFHRLRHALGAQGKEGNNLELSVTMRGGEIARFFWNLNIQIAIKEGRGMVLCPIVTRGRRWKMAKNGVT